MPREFLGLRSALALISERCPVSYQNANGWSWAIIRGHGSVSGDASRSGPGCLSVVRD